MLRSRKWALVRTAGPGIVRSAGAAGTASRSRSECLGVWMRRTCRFVANEPISTGRSIAPEAQSIFGSTPSVPLRRGRHAICVRALGMKYRTLSRPSDRRSLAVVPTLKSSRSIRGCGSKELALKTYKLPSSPGVPRRQSRCNRFGRKIDRAAIHNRQV